MAGPRQKKKQRSSRSTVKTGTTGRTKAGKKKVNFLGNEIIAKNWDRTLTLAQNYDNLGLSVRLQDRTGGVEKKKNLTAGNADGRQDGADYYIPENSFKISTGGVKLGQLIPSEVAVEHDAETGAILRILGGDHEDNQDESRRNGAVQPLNDLLNELEESNTDDDSDTYNEDNGVEDYMVDVTSKSIVKQLEAQAALESEQLAQKKPRQQSSREEEWIQTLVEKHGNDYTAMFRDKKLNPRQQSEGDIKRRVGKWTAKRNSG